MVIDSGFSMGDVASDSMFDSASDSAPDVATASALESSTSVWPMTSLISKGSSTTTKSGWVRTLEPSKRLISVGDMLNLSLSGRNFSGFAMFEYRWARYKDCGLLQIV